MTLSTILDSAVKSAPKLSRAQIAADNYSFLTGKRAPDNLPESWADRFVIINIRGQL